MALPHSTTGDYFRIPEAMMAGKPKSGYTPAVGHLVVEDATLTDGYDRAAANENPIGIIISTNGGNGTISVARLIPGVSTIRLEYIGSNPSIGQTMEAGSTPAFGTVTITDRDVVELDNTNGNLRVLAVDTSAKTVVVERVAITRTP
jgi:hypothetical protein